MFALKLTLKPIVSGFPSTNFYSFCHLIILTPHGQSRHLFPLIPIQILQRLQETIKWYAKIKENLREQTMSSDPSTNKSPYLTLSQSQVRGKRRPTWRTIALVLLALVSSTSLEYYFLQDQSPDSIKNNLVVLLVFNIILILLFTLIVLITRNLVKLYSERKSQILGAKFQTKLITAFLILTLVPSILLFTVASKLFTLSIGSWFIC